MVGNEFRSSEVELPDSANKKTSGFTHLGSLTTD